MRRFCSSKDVDVFGSPWPNIRSAVRQVFSNNSSSTLWYSLMAPGNLVLGNDDGTKVTQSYATANMSAAETIDVLNSGFSNIKILLQALFSNTYSPFSFTMDLKPRGQSSSVETGTSIPSSSVGGNYSLLTNPAISENVGDLRVSMIPIDGSGFTLAFAYSPSNDPNIIGNVGGDSRFDTAECWRRDIVTQSNCFSLLYTAVHEFLHNFAMGHDNTANSVLRPFVSDTDSLANFPGGLLGSQEFFTVHKVYAGDPFVMGLGSRVISVLTGTAISNPSPTSLVILEGRLISIAVSARGYVWGTGRKDLVYFRSGITSNQPYGKDWTPATNHRWISRIWG